MVDFDEGMEYFFLDSWKIGSRVFLFGFVWLVITCLLLHGIELEKAVRLHFCSLWGGAGDFDLLEFFFIPPGQWKLYNLESQVIEQQGSPMIPLESKAADKRGAVNGVVPTPAVFTTSFISWVIPMFAI